MLSLTRYDGQRVILTLEDGRLIVVEAVESIQGKCRIGFEAPKSIVIDREEVYLRKREKEGNADA
jgi:sRNA-binding carbon storage regulator CsrA